MTIPVSAWDNIAIANAVVDEDIVFVLKQDGKFWRAKASMLGAAAAHQAAADVSAGVQEAIASVQLGVVNAQKSADNLSSSVSIVMASAQATIGANRASFDDFVTLQTDQNSTFATEISTLTAAVGTAAKISFQSTSPTSPLTGDLWIDSGNNNSLKRWNGSSWDDVNNTDIAAAIAAVSTEASARATADSAISSTVTSVAAIANGSSASGSMKLVANVSPADGATAQFDVQIATSSAGTFSNAGMSMQILSGGTRRIKFNADQFIVTNGTTNSVPFAIVGTDLLASALKVPNANVNGLGALALLSSVSASTQVTGLGLIAFINKLTSGNLATYMDTAIISDAYIADLSAGKINTGTLSAATISIAGASGSALFATPGSNMSAVQPFMYAANFSNNGGYTSYNAINAVSTSVEAIWGQASGGAGAHGVRGLGPGGTSGIVGTGAGYDFYADGSGTNYGPFTGSHDAVALPEHEAAFEIGDIVVDVECVMRRNVSNTLFRIELSSAPNQTAVVGVVAVKNGVLGENSPPAVFGLSYPPENAPEPSIPEIGPPYLPSAPKRPGPVWPDGSEAAWNAIKDTHHYVLMNALGEGQVNVCGEGGDIAAGDLIVASSTAGKGMKQADDIVRSFTVAKAREAATFSGPTDIKQIACIYLCG